MTEETVSDLISDIKEMLELSHKDCAELYPAREGVTYDSLKKSGWRKVRERVRQMQNRIEYLEETQEEIEKLVRTGKTSCETSNKKVLEDVEEILSG